MKHGNPPFLQGASIPHDLREVLVRLFAICNLVLVPSPWPGVHQRSAPPVDGLDGTGAHQVTCNGTTGKWLEYFQFILHCARVLPVNVLHGQMCLIGYGFLAKSSTRDPLRYGGELVPFQIRRDIVLNHLGYIVVRSMATSHTDLSTPCPTAFHAGLCGHQFGLSGCLAPCNSLFDLRS